MLRVRDLRVFGDVAGVLSGGVGGLDGEVAGHGVRDVVKGDVCVEIGGLRG